MTPADWSPPKVEVPDVARDRAVLQSSLWAAVGDALGWITELSHGPESVVRRTGRTRVTRPVAWQRVVGGRGSPKVELPAGTYSDDTQMRLAVSRAIRGDGSFDVEAFAKIEMTVWPTYALGAGLGSKAAAVNLTRRGVNWFSNFYDRGSQKYVNGGGNGAAMRIQPHAWSSAGDHDLLIGDVLRDAIVTHGHPHGFCGAIFHALSLEGAIRNGSLPSPEKWMEYLDRCLDLPRLMEPQLSAFWLSGWETRVGISLPETVTKFRDEGQRDIELIQSIDCEAPAMRYKRAIEQLGCLTPQYRGSGWKTALAALALAYFFRNRKIEEALETAVNELGSDTDTIATMAGALLGAVSNRLPAWPLQDSTYIADEARRLSFIARGQYQDSFTYPDLGHWNPPVRQYASTGLSGDRLAMAGLGELTALGEGYSLNDLVWQWCELPFGQTILAKRKVGNRGKVAATQLPGPRQKAVPKTSATTLDRDKALPVMRGLFESSETKGDSASQSVSDHKQKVGHVHRGNIDAWTDQAISSNFNDQIVGRLLNRCIDESQSVETAIGFASIIAKAKLARKRRGR